MHKMHKKVLASKKHKPHPKVLLVEDELIIGTMLKAQMRQGICKHLSFVEAINVEDAINDYIENKDIGLIILDFNLCGDKNGSDFIKAIKDINDGRDVVIVANSTEPTNNQQMMRDGADYIIEKSYHKLEEFLRKNEKVIIVRRCSTCRTPEVNKNKGCPAKTREEADELNRGS